MASGIYIIKCSGNGKFYIGQAQNFDKRWKAHIYDLKNNTHKNKHLQNMWNKYGEDCFTFHKWEYCPIEDLTVREQHFLDIYWGTPLCINISPYAEVPMRGRTASEITRRKLSEAAKNISEETRRKKSEAAKNISEETRRKMSEAQKNRPPISEETRRKLSEAAKNISEETRRKMSESSKNRPRHPHSEESRRKMSESAKNRPRHPHSEESRRKMSESVRGRPPISEETRHKMSEAQKRLQERKRLARELAVEREDGSG